MLVLTKLKRKREMIKVVTFNSTEQQPLLLNFYTLASQNQNDDTASSITEGNPVCLATACCHLDNYSPYLYTL